MHSPALRAILPHDAIYPPDEELCLRSAEALEAPFVNVAHFRGHMIPLQQMAEAIGQICRRARTRGLQVALEFIPGTGLPDLSFAQKVIESCGESNCKITLDFWHLDRSGGTIQDILHLTPGIIAGLQLCDRIPPAPGTPYIPMSGRDLPGEGQLPLHDLVRSALTNSPGISAEVEVFKEDLRVLPAGRCCCSDRCDRQNMARGSLAGILRITDDVQTHIRLVTQSRDRPRRSSCRPRNSRGRSRP